jgi:uncharacterized protein
MATTPVIAIDLRRVAQGVQMPLAKVERVAALLDAGNTIPFITRYRKDQTGGLDEEQIRAIQERIVKARLLAERKQTILRSIESQGKLTPELQAEIEGAESTKRLEDLYLPYKPKKQTLATAARERGLEPLADEILSASEAALNLELRAADFVNPDKGLPGVADVLLGVGHIVAEIFSERADVRQKLRKIVHKSGKLVCNKIPEIDEKQAAGFRDYFEFAEHVERVPPHRVLAINRGERAKILRVKVDADQTAMESVSTEMLVPAEHPHGEFLKGCALDALARLNFPSLEREIRRELTDNAEGHAVHVFARNLRNLLLQPPVAWKRVLAMDPGFRSGCKLAALDEFGKMLDHAVIHVVGKAERKQEGREKLVSMITTHQINVVAIGNGTACRETEDILSDILNNELKDAGASYVIVNEAGASVYSTSPLGREELPEYDATLRGAISIGRRLQDPLSELVKIDPGSIGVGLYQHDVKAKHLRTSLDDVVESCVSFVGVDVNSASPALLRYVSGLNQLTARRLYDHRVQHGPFHNRQQLNAVSGFGEASFVQAAGFLKIVGGDNPLDATWIHPESYDLASQVLAKLGGTPADLLDKERAEEISKKASELDLAALSGELNAGELLLKDIISQIGRPGRDPREDLPPPIFKKGVIKLDDLSPGMELAGTVLNVVDFGAFVDIGLHDTGLVHISQIANKYIRDPHDVVSVGDIVKVWVHEIDKDRRRVSLTMIAPGTPRVQNEKPSRPPREGKPGDKKRGKGKRGKGDAKAKQRDKPPVPAAPAPPPPPPKPTFIDRTPRPPSSRIGAKGKRPFTQGGPGGKRPGPGKGPNSAGPAEQTAAVAAAPPKKQPEKIIPSGLSVGSRSGKEPMRTFGDLKALFSQTDESESATEAASSTSAPESSGE